MATTTYFEEVILDQGGEHSLEVEVGRCSYYNGSALPGGKIGEDSIYLTVGEKTVIMDRETAAKFVEAAQRVGHYFGLGR